MARTGPVLFPANVDVSQDALLAGFDNSGVTRVASPADLAAIPAPQTVYGFTPELMAWVDSESQFYRFRAGVWARVYPSLEVPSNPNLLTLLQARGDSPAGGEGVTLPTSAEGLVYLQGQGLLYSRVAMRPQDGFPNWVEYTRDVSGQPTTETFAVDADDRTPEFVLPVGSDTGFLVFRLAQQLPSGLTPAELGSMVIKGSRADRAVLSPNLGRGTGAGAGAGGAVTSWGQVGYFMRSGGSDRPDDARQPVDVAGRVRGAVPRPHGWDRPLLRRRCRLDRPSARCDSSDRFGAQGPGGPVPAGVVQDRENHDRVRPVGVQQHRGESGVGSVARPGGSSGWFGSPDRRLDGDASVVDHAPVVRGSRRVVDACQVGHRRRGESNRVPHRPRPPVFPEPGVHANSVAHGRGCVAGVLPVRRRPASLPLGNRSAQH